MRFGLLAAGQSPLAPRSGPAHDISTLWWWMLGIAAVVFAGAVFLIVLSIVRRRREGLPLLGEREQATTGLVILFGIVIPVVVLVGLFVVANLVVLPDTDAPKAGTTAMTVEVVGHQWWWEVRYPGAGNAVTANEIHIPARTRVNVVAKTADVIHTFWVPQLNRKIDMVPGHPNRLLLYASKPGRYRGQCAEFCGVQHAHMSLAVYADPPDQFRAWLANMGRPAAPPATPQAQAGQKVFLSNACASCHTLRGTPATGVIGPDLTHMATRATLAALTIPNNTPSLGEWLRDPQHVKPGNRMPGLNLTPTQFTQLTAYLQGLR